MNKKMMQKILFLSISILLSMPVHADQPKQEGIKDIQYSLLTDGKEQVVDTEQYGWQEAYTNYMPWQYVDFDESMQTARFAESIAATEQIVGLQGELLLDFFRVLYKKNNLSRLKPEQELKIPKIIHFIWLGSPLPEEFKPLLRSWIQHHEARGWRFKLWLDKDVESFPLYNRKEYDSIDNYGMKSDILKWEIMYHFGGVYVDVDYECLKPLDILHYTYDFYTGIQPLDTQVVQLGAALFAARPKHPILKHCIETIKTDWHHKGAPKKSGPVHFTKSFALTAGKDGSKDVALPASYLYPQGCRQRKYDPDKWVDEGAYAIHHWAKSWMPKKYRLKKFRDLKHNEQATNSWND